jgi:hypothetical protein
VVQWFRRALGDVSCSPHEEKERGIVFVFNPADLSIPQGYRFNFVRKTIR